MCPFSKRIETGYLLNDLTWTHHNLKRARFPVGFDAVTIQNHSSSRKPILTIFRPSFSLSPAALSLSLRVCMTSPFIVRFPSPSLKPFKHSFDVANANAMQTRHFHGMSVEPFPNTPITLICLIMFIKIFYGKKRSPLRRKHISL